MRRVVLYLLAVSLLSTATSLAAQRSMKDEEIVVVGSKVKEVIREAGLRSDGELVQAVSDKVLELLDDAMMRARLNRRFRVRPDDYGNGTCQTRGREIVVVGSKVKDVVREAGLRAGDDLVAEISAEVHAMLATAIHRAMSNGRSTVRPYDL